MSSSRQFTSSAPIATHESKRLSAKGSDHSKKKKSKQQTDSETPTAPTDSSYSRSQLPVLNFDLKDERLQIKATITFFALKSAG